MSWLSGRFYFSLPPLSRAPLTVSVIFGCLLIPSLSPCPSLSPRLPEAVSLSPLTPRAGVGRTRHLPSGGQMLSPPPRLKLFLKPPLLSTLEMASSFYCGPYSEPQSQELGFHPQPLPATLQLTSQRLLGRFSTLLQVELCSGLLMLIAASLRSALHVQSCISGRTLSVRSVVHTSHPRPTWRRSSCSLDLVHSPPGGGISS